MVEFSKVNLKDIEDEYDVEEEEAGEEAESAPPLRVGEERQFNSTGLVKKLIKEGLHWETPKFGDEVTVHYVGRLLDGSTFMSTRISAEPFTFKLGSGEVACGLDQGIVTMRKGEIAIFTLPPELAHGASDVPLNSTVQFEIELLSWITIVDVCRDGGIIKKIMKKGDAIGPPGDLDEVRVSYEAALLDGTIIAKTPDEGIEFYVKDGHFCVALAKGIKTMTRGEKARLVVQPQYAFGQVEENCNDEFPCIPPNSVLSIFVELLSFKRVVDITGDSKVIKKVLKEGEGASTADEGATVKIRYTAMLEDGTIFERKGYDDGSPLELITDEEQVIAGLDRAVSTMKKNELATIKISSEFGFGCTEVMRDLAVVPPSSTVIYEVEMLDFVREKAPWELNTRERIETAARKKEEGNQLFKNGNYQRAAKKYDKAADYLSEDGPFIDDDEKVAKTLRLSCWLNGAACCLKLNNFKEAINLCSKILDMESCNVKALYRRAQAYIEITELHLANVDIRKGLEVDPQNREMKLLQKTLRKLEAESNKKDAKLYRAMFSQITTDANITAVKRLKTGEENKRDEHVSDLETDNGTVTSEAANEF